MYDVTSYVEEHPGGDAILAHAGDDSTEGFFGYVFPSSITHDYSFLACSGAIPDLLPLFHQQMFLDVIF